MEVENYKEVGAIMTVGELIEFLEDSPPEAGAFIGGPDFSDIDGLAPNRDPVTKVCTIRWGATKEHPRETVGYVSIFGTPATEEEIAAYKAEVESVTEEEEREVFESANAAANAYVEAETAKFIAQIKRDVIRQWGDPSITSACLRDGIAGRVHSVTREVISAIGGEVC